jgi:hypothetical protein
MSTRSEARSTQGGDRAGSRRPRRGPGFWSRVAVGGAAALVAASALLSVPAAVPAAAARQGEPAATAVVPSGEAGPAPAVPFPDGPRAQQPGATIGEILNDPTLYYGLPATIGGRVGRVLGPRSFTVHDPLTDLDRAAGEVIPVLGIGPLAEAAGRPLALNALAGQQVRLSGTVHQFNLAAFEDRFNLDLVDNAWASFAGRPAIAATLVVPVTSMQIDVVPGVSAALTADASR